MKSVALSRYQLLVCGLGEVGRVSEAMKQEANLLGRQRQRRRQGAGGFSARITAILQSTSSSRRQQQTERQPERAAAVRGCAPASPGNAAADVQRTLDRPPARWPVGAAKGGRRLNELPLKARPLLGAISLSC